MKESTAPYPSPPQLSETVLRREQATSHCLLPSFGGCAGTIKSVVSRKIILQQCIRVVHLTKRPPTAVPKSAAVYSRPFLPMSTFRNCVSWRQNSSKRKRVSCLGAIKSARKSKSSRPCSGRRDGGHRSHGAVIPRRPLAPTSVLPCSSYRCRNTVPVSDTTVLIVFEPIYSAHLNLLHNYCVRRFYLFFFARKHLLMR